MKIEAGDKVIVHGAYNGQVRKICSRGEVAVVYMKGGISFVERVSRDKITPRPTEPPLARLGI